ncbi:tetratricopeptide repeat protein [Nonomuraea sp. 3-1Str]|uniref:tetratricopeptide repeat protein n=1 Tax=Nonomuraea sp. 3-1Str TaxID=2929801 RepID=UPI00285CC70D|nr:tetratricopeptide repeat protein [Nonomuraea sp. 3-1Str]MDR8413140.1 tetratricopeptide repeat protein [Nonomuraea sp. 3-1Str]
MTEVPPPRGERSVELHGDNHGIITTGDHVNITQLVTRIEAVRPVEGVAVPRGLGNVPAVPRTFVGREEDLEVLHERLIEDRPVVVRALHGMGGVGKSTLAARYARQYRDHYEMVWWIVSDTEETVSAGLADLAVALQPELGGLPAQALTLRAKAWLACHSGWLLICDNAPGPGVLGDLATAADGRMIITSRLAHGWHTLGADTVQLDVLDEAASLELLLSFAPPGQADAWPGAADLAAHLGGLPLAIEQAGAYLQETDLTPEAYLRLLRDQPARLHDSTAEGSAGRATIAQVWKTTLDTIGVRSPLPGDLLAILAWLGPEPVPRTVFRALAEPKPVYRRRRLWERRDRSGWSTTRALCDSLDVEEALGLLGAYNMVSLTSESVTVHRLIQEVTRTAEGETPGIARDRAAILLELAFPANPSLPAAWTEIRALLPHITALASRTPKEADGLALTFLLWHTSVFLGEQGDVLRAVALLDRSLESARRLYGAVHPVTLYIRDALGVACQDAGELGDAIALLKANLADRRARHGRNDPLTFESRRHLAHAYQAADDHANATRLFEQLLADRERLLGPHDPLTLQSRHDLANAHYRAGDEAMSIPLFEEALAACEAVLGPAHGHTLAVRNNLALACAANGEEERATALLRRNLDERERELGGDHPDTLLARFNLADVHARTGDEDGALAMLEAVVEDGDRVLDGLHPDRLANREGLADAYLAAKNYTKAIPLLEELLEDRERALGPDHPTTLNTRCELAGAYALTGGLDRALPMFEEVLAARERVQGDDHPRTLDARRDLALAFEQAEQPYRAIPLFKRVLADSSKLFGRDHPGTLDARQDLASAYQSVDDLKRAVPLYVEAAEGFARLLGEDDPKTFGARRDLGFAYEQVGDHVRALRQFERALPGHELVLGPDHVLTRAVRDSLRFVAENLDWLGDED